MVYQSKDRVQPLRNHVKSQLGQGASAIPVLGERDRRTSGTFDQPVWAAPTKASVNLRCLEPKVNKINQFPQNNNNNNKNQKTELERKNI